MALAELHRRLLGFIVGKRAGAPDGASVVFVAEGDPTRIYPVVVDGRALFRSADPCAALTPR